MDSLPPRPASSDAARIAALESRVAALEDTIALLRGALQPRTQPAAQPPHDGPPPRPASAAPAPALPLFLNGARPPAPPAPAPAPTLADEAQREEVLRRGRAGDPCKTIALAVGLPDQRVAEILDAAGIPRRRIRRLSAAEKLGGKAPPKGRRLPPHEWPLTKEQIVQQAKERGLPPDILRERLARGWPLAAALTRPHQPRKRPGAAP